MKKTLLTLALACCATAAQAGLYITQYYEGTSNNKYLELTNLGSDAIDFSLTTIYLGTWSNANRDGWLTNLAPTNTFALNEASLGITSLASGATIVIKNPLAALPEYAAAAAIAGSSFGVSFNGDDSIGLWSGDAVYSTALLTDVLGVSANIIGDISLVRTSIGVLQTSGYTTLDEVIASGMWASATLSDVATAESNTDNYLGYTTLTPVPEPSTYALVAMGGLLAMGAVLRRRRA